MGLSVDAQAAPALEPVLDSRWAMRRAHMAAVALFGVLFVALNLMPLRGTDLWGHVAYGKWIAEHGGLPTNDPFLPLAHGMRVVDNAWLSQLAFFGLHSWGGAEALSAIFALTLLAAHLILAWLFLRQTRRLDVTLVAVAATLAVGWSRLATIRPENFGLLLFAALLALLLGRQFNPAGERQTTWSPSWRKDAALWIATPAIFILWANLHGSFVCGLALIGCFFLGRVIETAWETRSFSAAVHDRGAWRWIVLGQLTVLASLINPYGIDLLLETLFFAKNDNLRDVTEWQPLSLIGTGGMGFALSWVALVFLARHSQRRFAVADVLLLAVFSAASAMSVRMLGWYAAVYACVVAPHLGDIAARWLPQSDADEPVSTTPALDLLSLHPGRSWSYSLVCLLLFWIAFAISPVGGLALGGAPRDVKRIVDRATPVDLSEHLRKEPVAGLVFVPQWWGDWLVWNGPENFQPFMTTSIHLAPRQVWRDYQRVLGAQSGWEIVLGRYAANAIIVDKSRQASLLNAVRESSRWRVAYEDEQALLAVLNAGSPSVSAERGVEEGTASISGS